MSSTMTVARTGLSNIDGLLSGVKWDTPFITYSMPSLAASYDYSGERDSGFRAASAAQSAAIDRILRHYEEVLDLDFRKSSSSGDSDIRFAGTKLTATAWAYEPSNISAAGDVWFNSSSALFANPAPGTYGNLVLIHEIGHALGLKHAHDAGVYGAVSASRNSMEFSVMTYASYIGASTARGFLNEASSYAQSLMMDDIAALQTMYGADFETRAGNSVYRWDPSTGQQFVDGVGQGRPSGNHVFLTVWDGGGNDTYDFSNYRTNLSVNLNPGAWSTLSRTQLADLGGDGRHLARGNIANALLFNGDIRSLIENVRGGTGHDTITGNSTNNGLWGGSGNDCLSGGVGNDTLVGGLGADKLYGGAGTDTVYYGNATSGVTLNLSTGGTAGDAKGDYFSSIENATGSRFADIISGSAAGNVLSGGAGNDILSGSTGDDTLVGGTGADKLYGGTGTDTASYANAAGGVTLTLASKGATGDAHGDTYSSIENVFGSRFGDIITGTASNNRLEGRDGADRLNGGGGHDTLIGGNGADTLMGGSGYDTFVFMTPNQGGDTILDFAIGTDKIAVGAADFAGLIAGGTLSADQFELGNQATGAHESFVFDAAAQTLWWDADGAGPGAAMFIARLTGVSTLSATDFLII